MAQLVVLVAVALLCATSSATPTIQAVSERIDILARDSVRFVTDDGTFDVLDFALRSDVSGATTRINALETNVTSIHAALAGLAASGAFQELSGNVSTVSSHVSDLEARLDRMEAAVGARLDSINATLLGLVKSTDTAELLAGIGKMNETLLQVKASIDSSNIFSRVDTLDSTVSGLSSSSANLADGLDKVNMTLEAVRLSLLTNDIINRVGSLDSSVSELTQHAEKLGDRVSAVNASVLAVEGVLSTNNVVQRLAALDQATAGLAQFKSATDERLNSLEGTTYATDISTLQQDVSAIKQVTDAVPGRFTAVETKASNNEQAIGTLTTRVGDVETLSQDNEGAVIEAAGDIGSLATRLTDLEAIVRAIRKDGSSPNSAAESCLELLNGGFTTNGAYYIKSSVGAFQAYCDMTGGGWMLVGIVHSASTTNVNEPNDWFVTGLNKDDETLRSATNVVNRSPCAHGKDRLQSYFTSRPSPVMRVRILAELDFNQRRHWYKEMNFGIFSVLFTTASQSTTKTCYDEGMTVGCFNSIIGRSGDVTTFSGMHIRTSDGGGGSSVGGDLHMRQNSDGSPQYSGVCSSTGASPEWKDAAIDGHWGNRVEIWIR